MSLDIGFELAQMALTGLQLLMDTQLCIIESETDVACWEGTPAKPRAVVCSGSDWNHLADLLDGMRLGYSRCLSDTESFDMKQMVERSGFSHLTLRRAINKGRLASHKDGRGITVLARDFNRWMAYGRFESDGRRRKTQVSGTS